MCRIVCDLEMPRSKPNGTQNCNSHKSFYIPTNTESRSRNAKHFKLKFLFIELPTVTTKRSLSRIKIQI